MFFRQFCSKETHLFAAQLAGPSHHCAPQPDQCAGAPVSPTRVFPALVPHLLDPGWQVRCASLLGMHFCSPSVVSLTCQRRESLCPACCTQRTQHNFCGTVARQQATAVARGHFSPPCSHVCAGLSGPFTVHQRNMYLRSPLLSLPLLQSNQHPGPNHEQHVSH